MPQSHRRLTLVTYFWVSISDSRPPRVFLVWLTGTSSSLCRRHVAELHESPTSEPRTRQTSEPRTCRRRVHKCGESAPDVTVNCADFASCPPRVGARYYGSRRQADRAALTSWSGQLQRLQRHRSGRAPHRCHLHPTARHVGLRSTCRNGPIGPFVVVIVRISLIIIRLLP